MSTSKHSQTISGTFADPRQADLCAETIRKAGFEVWRRSGGVVSVRADDRGHHADEVRGYLAAYGAQEFAGAAAARPSAVAPASSGCVARAARAWS